MIPEALKRLLQPWLKQTDVDLLIEYIRQQKSIEETDVSELHDGFADDMPTVQLSEAERSVASSISNTLLEENSIESFEILESMHFHETPPVEISGVPEKRYQPEIELGRGGMATVWRAFDPQLQRFVALKQMHENKALERFEVENFMVEAQITAQLQHPGIVPIHELAQSPEQEQGVYFTMREVQGRTLKEIMKEVHRVSTDSSWETSYDGWNLRRLMEMVQSVCVTLAYAHDNGVVHQDIKPNNIMIGAYGEVLVVDWGIAKLASWYGSNPKWVSVRSSQAFIDHRKKAVSGTPQYIAPEQLQGDVTTLSSKCDMFALGVILFEILSEEKPFVGSTKKILQRKYAVKSSPRLSVVLRQKKRYRLVPQALIDICERAMKYDPQRRFPNMLQMAKALQDWLDGVQQEDKARQLLLEVGSLKSQIRTLQGEIEQHRQDWERSLQGAIRLDSVDGDHAWLSWTEIEQRHVRIVELNREIQRACHAALMVAPQLTQIHQELLEVEFPEFQEALSMNNQRLIQKVEQRLQMLVDGLGLKATQRWKERIRLAKKSRMSAVHVDRTAIQQDIWLALMEHRWVSIVGLAGVGKTHLAWNLARKWCVEYHTDIVFCDMSDVKSRSECLQLLFATLGLHHGFEDPLFAIIECLSRRDDCVLLIDNAEQLNAESIELLQNIYSNVETVLLLVTSRTALSNQVSGIAEQVIPLNTMSLVEGIELFVHHCKEHSPTWHWTAEHRRMVVRLVQQLDGIPLAIELAGGRLAEMPLHVLYQSVTDRFVVLKSRSTQLHRTLFAAIEWSAEGVPRAQRRLLEKVSICPQSFTMDMAQALSTEGGSGSHCVEHLESLVQQQLLVRTIGSMGVEYSMLSSVREFFQLSLSDVDNKALCVKHAQYWYQLLRQRPCLDAWEHSDWEWAFHNKEHLTMASGHALNQEAWLLSEVVIERLAQQGPWSRALEILEGLCARGDVTDWLRFRWRVLLLKFHRLLQRPAEHSALQVELMRQVQDVPLNREQGEHLYAHWELLFEVVDQCLATGEMVYAETIFNRLKELVQGWTFERTLLEDDRTWGQFALQSGCKWAVWLYQSGRVEEGIEVLEPIFHMYHREGWWHRTAHCANSLGEMYNRLNQPDRGLSLLEIARKIFDKLGLVAEMNTLEKIGMVHQRQGRYEEAKNFFQQALESGKRHNCFVGSLYCNMGSISHVLGDYVSAMEQFHQGIRILRRKNIRRLEAIFLSNLALSHHMIGQYEEAERLFLEDVQLATDMKLYGHVVLVHRNLGNLYLDMNESEKALHHLNLCVEQAAEFYPLARIVFLGSLGLGYAMAGDVERAVSVIKSQSLNDIAGYKEEYIQALCKQVVIYSLANDPDKVEELKETLRGIDSDEFASDSMVKRWLNRIFKTSNFDSETMGFVAREA